MMLVTQVNLFDPEMDTNYNKFIEFNTEYPKVYELFEKFTMQLIYKGHSKLGAKMIIERIRWEMATESKDEKGFKINNNYTCYYSRLFIKKNPRHSKVFDFREVKN
jgi:hypothetical protein